MKILSLRFKNLNSLYGEWHIDFTDPAYTQNGLFLLTGPTGAGKTTILDAVCLALYGQTPRLGKITQNSNEIMSKHTADCYALLHFETKGIHYYARFEQRKARNNAKGKLQDVERSIAKDTPDGILCRKKTEINDEIAKITGMDFQRFTRSILLAQGAFDSFLKAKDEEKSMLLEQITGTEIYSQISKIVFERAKTEKEAIKELSLKSENAVFLSPEELQQLQNSQKELTEQQQAINKELQTIQKNLLWYGQLENLEQKITAAQNDRTRLLAEEQQAEEKKIRLSLAEKAEKVFPLYQTAHMQEEELSKLAAALTGLQTALPQKEEKLNAVQKNAEALGLELQQLKHKNETDKPLFDEVKKTDILIGNNKQTIKNAGEKIQRENTSLQKLKTELSILQKEKDDIQQKLTAANAWLTANTKYELLNQELSGIKQSLATLQNTVQTGQELKNQLTRLEKELAAHKQNKALQEQKHVQLQTTHQTQEQREKQLTAEIAKLLQGKLLRELKTQSAHLEEKKYYLYKIAGYEQQRKELQDGQPCPLCGAVHHPFMHEKLPEQNSVDQELKALKEKIDKIETMQQEQEKLQILLKQNQEQLTLYTQNLQTLSEQEKEKETLLAEYAKKRETLLTVYETQKGELQAILLPFNISEAEISPSHIPALTQTLQDSLTLWNNRQKEKQNLENSLQETEKNHISLQSQTTALENNIKQKQSELTAEENRLAELCKHRQDLFGTKNPLEEEQKLSAQILQTENRKEKIQQEKERLQTELVKNREEIRQLGLTLNEKTAQHQKDKEQLQHALAEQNFASAEELLSAKTDEKTIQTLREYFQKLEQDIQVRQKQLAELQQNLENEKNKNLTDSSKEELINKENTLKEQLKTIFISLGEIQEKLTQNEKNLTKYQNILAEIEKQKEKSAKWECLNQLIGSADGKKFRTIAQGITFEQVIRYANAKLQLLQKRYLLVRDKEQPLCLNVLDTYQGGEIRAVQNLSGGESFIVSLSLALGLSQMASQNVQVDSLFLDEGFGTLDEESLDTALSTLAGIQQEGKIIGVISHIGLLKERIATQISVQPAQGGKSILTGAGCTKIS